MSESIPERSQPSRAPKGGYIVSSQVACRRPQYGKCVPLEAWSLLCRLLADRSEPEWPPLLVCSSTSTLLR